MNSGGIALGHVQDVGQVAIFIPPQWNMPIAKPWKEKGSYVLRQVPAIAIGDDIVWSFGTMGCTSQIAVRRDSAVIIQFITMNCVILSEAKDPCILPPQCIGLSLRSR
jgi:hypothetical protein